MTSRKPLECTFSIFVRFRKRRLVLRRRIRSLEAARELLQSMRAQRFHDAEHLFLVDDRTGEEVHGAASADPRSASDERSPDEGLTGAALRPNERPASAALRPTPNQDPPDAALWTATWVERVAGAEPEPWRGKAGAEKPPVAPRMAAWEAASEPPLTRLQRSILAARKARRRYAAAVSTLANVLLAFKAGEHGGYDALERLLESSRILEDLGGRALAQLDGVVRRLALSMAQKREEARCAERGPAEPPSRG